jgi:hypothetical protein
VVSRFNRAERSEGGEPGFNLPTRATLDFCLNRLLVVVGMMVMVVVMMVWMYYHHDLRLRRIRYCEAEDENSSKQKLLHTS